MRLAILKLKRWLVSLGIVFACLLGGRCAWWADQLAARQKLLTNAIEQLSP